MSAPRLVVCGLEPGPAVALASGALLAALADERAVRPVLLGADLPLWRLLYGASARAPRILDPRLVGDAVAGELYDAWSSEADLTVVVAVEPALDRWEGVKGSRAVDVAVALDAPLVLVVDARERGATAAAAACGARVLAGGVEFAGAIVVGGDDQGAASDLRRILEETAKLPVLGWLPPQLSEQFARQYGGSQSGLRQIGPQPVKGGEAALCREAGTLPGPRGSGGGGRAPRLPAGAAAPAARAASGRHRPHARGRLGAAAPAVRARRRRPVQGHGPHARAPARRPRRGAARGRGRPLRRRPAGRGAAAGVRRQRRAQGRTRHGHRRRPADAGAGRRRAAAAAPPRRQPRPHPRARRGAAGRGRASRVVRAAPVRPRHGGAREPLRRGRRDAVRAVRPRVPHAAAGGVRLAGRRARRGGPGRGLRRRALPRDHARALPARHARRRCRPSWRRCGWRRRTREPLGARVLAAHPARPAHPLARHHGGASRWSRCSWNWAACPAGTTPPTRTRSSCCATASRSSGTPTGTAAGTAPSPTGSSSTGWRSTSPARSSSSSPPARSRCRSTSTCATCGRSTTCGRPGASRWS